MCIDWLFLCHIQDIPEGFELREKQQIQRSCELSGDIHVQKQEIQDFLNGLQYPLYYLDFKHFHRQYQDMRIPGRIN